MMRMFLFSCIAVFVFNVCSEINSENSNCNLRDLDGCWWFIENDKYWEICFNSKDKLFDGFLEDVHLLPNTSYLFVEETCDLTIYMNSSEIIEFSIDSISEDNIFFNDKNEDIVKATKISKVKYTLEEIDLNKEYYNEYSESFHNRMMVNRYGMPSDEIGK